MVDILTTIHGSRLGLTKGGHLTSQDSGFKGVLIQDTWVPGTEFVVAPSPHDKVTVFDDFLGKTMRPEWLEAHGNDGATVAYAINAALNGTVRGTMGAGAGVSMAANGVQLSAGLNYSAGSAGLVMEVSIKPSSITTMAIFVGFADVVTLQMPFTVSGTTVTSNAVDGCGVLFSSAGTGVWLNKIGLVGVANNTDATSQTTSSAYVTSAFNKVRIVVNSAGVMMAYLNGTQIGTATGLAAAITTTVTTAPIVASYTETAVAKTMDIDYFWAQQTRV